MKGSGFNYAMALAATILNAICMLIPPIIIRITLDSILGGEQVDAPKAFVKIIDWLGGVESISNRLWICTIAFVLVSIINGLSVTTRTRNVWKAAEGMAKRVKDRLYDHLQKLPYDYHIKAQSGDLIQRCTSDVETTRRFIQMAPFEVGRTILMTVFSLAVMFSVNVKLAFASMIMLPMIFLFALVFFFRVKKAFLKSDEKDGELSATIQENLSGMRVVRAFGRQKYELEKFVKRNEELRGLNKHLLHLLAIFWSFSDFLCLIQVGLTMFYGIFLAYKGEITVGTVVMFNTYVGMLIWPIRQMGRFLSDMGKMQVAVGRLFEILDTPEEQETPDSKEVDLNGDIVFDDVWFGYEKDKPVLKGLSFNVKQSETIAILGATGSGKSTLMHLLLRLYDYSDGSIKINGTELKYIKKRHLRDKIGIVLQEPFLFSKNVRDNIKMARHDAEESDIIYVTSTAAVHDDIMEFEKGYETIVGEKGVTLSGGQKQRVAIARTLIKNSDILIFDDSLSAVDTETDTKIRAALKERADNKAATTFIISQRITTLMQADRIFVLEDGKLSTSGTHKELIEKDGLYSRIWNIQSMLSEEYAGEIGNDSAQKAGEI